MDCDEAAADSKPGALWQRVNTQHGLLDWALGEIHSEPDSYLSRETQTATNKDCMAAKFPDTTAQDSGKQDTLSPAAHDVGA